MKSATRALLLVTAGAILASACGGGEARRQVIQNKGSDTLVNVAQAWAEEYQSVSPDVVVAVSGGGSGTGIAALINGTVDIANSSRQLQEKELKLARDSGQDPVEHVVGYDALAVFVHPANPLTEIDIPTLIRIYADGGDAVKWTDLGLEVPGCKDQTIVVVSRQNNSGTYAYFRQAVLAKADFRLGTRDMHGSKDVVDLVEKTPCAIGYSGLAYATDHTRMLCLAPLPGAQCVMPVIETAADRSYPIARPLFMYSNGQPQGFVKDYLDWILSDTGQCILRAKGYAPVHNINCSKAL